MQTRMPQDDGTLKTLNWKAEPIFAQSTGVAFNPTIYTAAHVVVDPFATIDLCDASSCVDWDATLAVRDHLYRGIEIAAFQITRFGKVPASQHNYLARYLEGPKGNFSVSTYIVRSQ